MRGAAAIGASLALGPSATGETAADGSAPSQGDAAGQFSRAWTRPTLTEPRICHLRDGSTTIDGEGRDLVVVLPERPLIARGMALRIENFRNLQLIGGEIVKPLQFDSRTGVTPLLHFPRMTRGFTGATGGTFRFGLKLGSDSKYSFTGRLPHNSSAAEVKAALESTAGDGSVLEVQDSLEQSLWTITPSLFDHRLGRPVLDTGGLQGRVSITSANAGFGELIGLWLNNFTGVAHIEGLWVHGEGLADALNVSSPHATAVLQLESCRFESEFYRYHPDHQHPDAAQFYCGPAELRCYRCDFIGRSQGQALLYQPVKEDWPGALKELRDPVMVDCLFATFPDQYSHRSPSGIPLYRDDSGPHDQNVDLKRWYWRMTNCYSYAPSRMSAKRASFARYWYGGGLPAPGGLIEGQLPASGTFANPKRNQCGVNYSPPKR